MATILVDYENVSMTDGLKGAEYLDENDTLIIFYSQCCEKIRTEYIEMIEKSRCEFKTYKLAHAGKNALDFYIAVECGCLSMVGERQIIIVSKDKGFGAIADFFNIKEELENATIHVASNIENALMKLNMQEDNARKQIIKEKTRALNIEAEQTRIKEQRAFAERISRAFAGTEYEGKMDEILNFVEKQEMNVPKLLYTGSLHAFGRKDGQAIYQRLKNIV